MEKESRQEERKPYEEKAGNERESRLDFKKDYRKAREAFRARVFEPQQFQVKKADHLDYGVGDQVEHIKFGRGRVLQIVEGGRDFEVTVDFEKAGVKKMFAAFAKLKKV